MSVVSVEGPLGWHGTVVVVVVVVVDDDLSIEENL